jgi:hypothetical protein
MSSGLILKMNSGYNGGEKRAREVHVVKGGNDLVSPALRAGGLL